MSIQWPGGIITPTPATPTGPYEDGSAPGVWTLDQAAFWIKQGLWPLAGNATPLGLFAGGGGAGGSFLGQIGKIVIPNTGNAVSWGSLAQDTNRMGACSSNTRALWGAGYATGAVNVTSIYYTTFSTSGTATSFGALNNGGSAIQELAGCSNNVRGIFGGGYDTGANYVCLISYVTISTTGNATNFGNLTVGRRQLGAASSSTRGVFVGGIVNSTDETNVMDYITIASTGNATSFGILTNRLSYISGCASDTRALFSGGLDFSGNFVNTIQYITIATTGNATSFGALTAGCYGTYSCASPTRGVIALGYTSSNSSVLNYVTIATTGNATTFGNLTVVAFYGGAAGSGASAVQPTATSSAMALFGGGISTSGTTQAGIQYVNIATTGNANLFGTLTTARHSLGAFSSSTRGVWGGGLSGPSNVIDYVTFSTFGVATDFGDIAYSNTNGIYGTSNSTRGLFFGGRNSGGTNTSTISYVEIASASNTTTFGDMSSARYQGAACASTTRAVSGGGNFDLSTRQNIIEYVTIASTGNTTDFGDLTTATSSLAACSSSTRGIFAGGSTVSTTNAITYITIASAGNSTSFGDLTAARFSPAGASSSTIGVFAGGYNATPLNTIDYVTIASTGNATVFGSLAEGNYALAGCSSAHGGL